MNIALSLSLSVIFVFRSLENLQHKQTFSICNSSLRTLPKMYIVEGEILGLFNVAGVSNYNEIRISC